MRRLGFVAFVSIVLFAGNAAAQRQPDRSNSQFQLNRNNNGVAEAEAARGKARAGDCAGALTLFDSAVRQGNIDPVVLRDRAICHDRLGNVFPAVEDYRAYLAGTPEAPDREQIQRRIDQLQPATTTDKVIVNTTQPETLSGESSASVYESSRRPPERKASRCDKNTASSIEDCLEQERLDDRADRSPLRFGKGVVIGAFAAFPRFAFFAGDPGVGWAAGGQFRYSFGRTLTGFAEFGWTGTGRFRDETRQPLYSTLLSGPMMQLGAEMRFGGKRMDNQIFVRGGLGYERYTDTDSRAYVNVLLGRFALGYRHVFSDALGLELGLDGGPGVSLPETGDANFGGIISTTFGLAFGL